MSKDVVEAIAAITRELPAIGKDESSPEVKYKFRGIETLIGHLAPLLAKYRLAIVPTTHLIDINREVENSKGKMPGWTETILRVEWQIIGPDGGIVHAATVGIGRDNSDKGSNKAQTQAFKYLLMELFAIGDKDDDGDRYAGTESDTPAPPADDDPDAWFIENGWTGKAEHDAAMVAQKDAIAKGEAAVAGFRDRAAVLWRERSMRTPMGKTLYETWRQVLELEYQSMLRAAAEAPNQ